MRIRDENLVDLLLEDHRYVAQTLARATVATYKGGLFCEIVQMLVVHEVAEEEIVYPAFLRIEGPVDEISERRLSEQAAVEGLLLDMERMDRSSPEFARAMVRLGKAVAAHAAQEERQVFRLLRSRLVEDELFNLGTAYQETKANAPAHLLVLGSVSRLIEEVRASARATLAGAR